ncbi:fluoride efflux transporter FluC [Halostreptopolyspora alba]|uniref:Fluoride-specific ion channel FluC n=1 Tax=Halostreptopolyspora alba TaxID=2487137 RepID=A0A3N0E925_9ACTN|nr:CrcB family protein [Nocardiopsaceae bacterium YIM 96095]
MPGDETGPSPGGPDIDAHVPRRGGEWSGAPWAVPLAVSLGGAAGALARYAVGAAVPHESGTFAWATLLVNVSGSFLIGVLMVLVTDVWPGRRLLRPFFGVGALGGYTTFATHIDDVQRMLLSGAAGPALAHLAGTVVGALLAVWAGVRVAGAVFRARVPGSGARRAS